MGLADRVRQREAVEQGEVPPAPTAQLVPPVDVVPEQHAHDWVPDDVAGYATCACGKTARLAPKQSPEPVATASVDAPESQPAAVPPPAAATEPPAHATAPGEQQAAQAPGDRVVGTITRDVQVSIPVTARQLATIVRAEAKALHNAMVDLAGRLGSGAPTIMLAAQMLMDSALRSERARAERESQQ